MGKLYDCHGESVVAFRCGLKTEVYPHFEERRTLRRLGTRLKRSKPVTREDAPGIRDLQFFGGFIHRETRGLTRPYQYLRR